MRPATGADASVVADIWFRGWRDGHEGHVPDALASARTETSFRLRASERVADTTVATIDGGVAGFIMVVEDEVEQVYVARAHRGTGVAAALLVKAEEIVAGNGHQSAWLAVVAGNARARRFYERNGWIDAGLIDYPAATDDGSISIPAHRYEKRLTTNTDNAPALAARATLEVAPDDRLPLRRSLRSARLPQPRTTPCCF